jgi:hypothetical protein
MISIILGATGRVSKSLRQYLGSIMGRRDIKEQYETAILSIEHILRKVLM